MNFDAEQIEGLLAHRRLSEAAAILALAPARRRLRAAVAALSGDDRSLARCVEPELLACRTGEEVAAYYRAANLEPAPEDHLIAGVVLAWRGDSAEAFGSLRAAHDRASAQRRFYLAAAARERLAHHALLFGEIETARTSIQEAIAIARTHRFSAWLLNSAAAAAHLGLDAGDLNRTEELLEQGRIAARAPAERPRAACARAAPRANGDCRGKATLRRP